MSRSGQFGRLKGSVVVLPCQIQRAAINQYLGYELMGDESHVLTDKIDLKQRSRKRFNSSQNPPRYAKSELPYGYHAHSYPYAQSSTADKMHHRSLCSSHTIQTNPSA
jgi:hypothetical protein